MSETTTTEQLREQVRARYAAAAVTVTSGQGTASCCDDCGDGGPCCGPTLEVDDTFGSALYASTERDSLPVAAVAASLGCGNPTAVAELRPGERVLDLGSGGGIDVLLSGRRVGETGFVYGVDMTDEMLDLARANAAQAGASNVEFLKGTIEDIPLPEASVDVVISNCVINLSVDKPKVITEMFRVLAPGGRIGISDVVAENHLTATNGPSGAPTSAASPEPCPARSISTASPLPDSPARPSVSSSRPRMACTARSSKRPSRGRQHDRQQAGQ